MIKVIGQLVQVFMSLSTRIQVLEFQATEAEFFQLGHNQTPDTK